MPGHRHAVRLLLALLLFMQYATLAHSIEHHLFDAAPSDCPEYVLQQHFGQVGPMAVDPIPTPGGITVIPATTTAVAVSHPHSPFSSRAPPFSP